MEKLKKIIFILVCILVILTIVFRAFFYDKNLTGTPEFIANLIMMFFGLVSLMGVVSALIGIMGFLYFSFRRDKINNKKYLKIFVYGVILFFVTIFLYSMEIWVPVSGLKR